MAMVPAPAGASTPVRASTMATTAAMMSDSCNVRRGPTCTSGGKWIGRLASGLRPSLVWTNQTMTAADSDNRGVNERSAAGPSPT